MKIIIGIPSYNEEKNIRFVTRQIDKGLKKFYKGYQSLIVNIDSASTDRTREKFLKTKTNFPKKYLNGGKNPRGKGKNILALFKFASEWGADYIAFIDSDVKTVKPAWPFLLLDPLITQKYDYTVPIYTRSCFDGNVTNHLIYPLIFSVFGLDLRQPIGGEFGLSSRLYKYLIGQPIDESTLGYGIDIFMTCHAIGGEFKICESFMGKKIHKPGFGGLMDKFDQIIYSAIKVSRFYTKKPIHQQLEVFHDKPALDKNKKRPNKDIVSEQLRQTSMQFGSKRVDYIKYTGSLTNKITNGMQIIKPRISSEIWTDFLSKFLKRCFSDDFNENDIHEIIQLISPVFFWRTVTFWDEIENLSGREIENKLTEQAKDLKRKFNLDR